MTDLLIVGRGLAASVLMHTCHRHNLSFKVIGIKEFSTCSQVAAGIWNPVVFKRMTESWKAGELVDFLKEFYSTCGNSEAKKFITLRRIIRPFAEEQEKLLWQKKAGAELKSWLDPVMHPANTLPETLSIKGEFGYVENAGNLDVKGFLNFTSEFFKDRITDELFEHNLLQTKTNEVRYKTHTAKGIVFCEGVKVSENPFFNWIPLKPAKGEILDVEIDSPVLTTDVLNKSAFLMPVGGNKFRIGATYEWQQLDEEPTEAGSKELVEKLRNMIKASYRISAHQAGIRPSAIDRRPIIGVHPNHSNLFVFNGLGAKGVMLAPFFANNFVLFYLQKRDLDPAVNCSRFYKLYGKKN